MSGGIACNCSERYEPLTVPEASNRPPRLWRVTAYRCNHSAFNGYHKTPSRYSAIKCLRCGAHWRTKAPYADRLPAIAVDEVEISSGYTGHKAAMEARGRTACGDSGEYVG